MTAQIGDKFKFEDISYKIVAINNPIEFDPTQYGITPAVVCTACWDGFWCEYNISNNCIVLENLYINSKNDFYPEIEGVLATTGKNPFEYMGHHLYKGLNIKIPYTGRILVGDDFLREYYIHMGYQRAWAYKTLIEFVFENGILIETKNHSKVAQDIRNKIKNDPTFSKKLHSNPSKFVKECFSLDFKIKAWWL